MAIKFGRMINRHRNGFGIKANSKNFSIVLSKKKIEKLEPGVPIHSVKIIKALVNSYDKM